jgi:GNAT superfamily N-acetyltransferase
MSHRIAVAETSEQFREANELFRQYAEFLGHDLEFQGFSEELESLPEMYGPPKGVLLLAYVEDEPVGVVGLREFEQGIAEMKRMYVLEGYQGRGIGKALTQAFLDHARDLGYQSVRLDSIRELDGALRLYRRFGFEEIEPYRFNPHPEAVFMELRIT